MAVRLSKVAREFNVGLSTIVDFLQDKGIKISSDPNAKLTEEQYALVAKEFSTDSEAKKESIKVDLKTSRQKKEAVTIDTLTNSQEEEEENKFISIKDEVKIENKIKVIDRIDLNRVNKPRQEEKAEEKKESKTVEQPRVKEVIRQTPKVENRPATVVPPARKQEPEKPVEKETNTEINFKSPTPTLKEVKVVGSIDLDSINQRTRPPKKSKQERERDKKELKRNKTIIPAKVDTPEDDSLESGDELEIRKKRKRILKKDEKIAVDSPKSLKIEENKKKLKKLKKKKATKAEITEEDVQKQIKDTFARLGSKGKTKAAKHRKDKREAVHQKMQAEMEQAEIEKNILKLTEFVTVSELANMMDISATEIISACMSLGLFVSINQRLEIRKSVV